MSLGSLTTVFAPDPSSCLDPDTFWMEERSQGDGLPIQGGPPFLQKPVCYPRDFIPVSTVRTLFNCARATSQQATFLPSVFSIKGLCCTSYYSPGICPSAYTVACSSTLIDQGLEVTAHVCCPDVYWQYSCPPNDATKELERSPWLTTLGCWSQLTTTSERTLSRVGIESNDVLTTMLRGGIIGAHAINVRFREGDFEGPIQTGGAEPPHSTSCINTSPPANDSDAGISPALAAGMSIASAVVVLLLAAAFWFLGRHLRRARSESSPADGSGGEDTAHTPEDATEPKPQGQLGYHTHEEPVPVAELGSHSRRMSWEKTWEHMTISPASAHGHDRGTQIKVDCHSAVSTGDRFSF